MPRPKVMLRCAELCGRRAWHCPAQGEPALPRTSAIPGGGSQARVRECGHRAARGWGWAAAARRGLQRALDAQRRHSWAVGARPCCCIARIDWPWWPGGVRDAVVSPELPHSSEGRPRCNSVGRGQGAALLSFLCCQK